MADDIVREAQEALEAAWVQDRENREDAFSDLKFLAGDQWPSQIRLQREAANRPCLTINRLPQFVQQVANDIRKNPPGIKAIPAGGDATSEIAEIFTGLFRQIQYRSNATHVFASAAYYAVACGIGHFRMTTEYAADDGFEQDIFIRRIPHPLSVFWDPDAIEPAREDAQYCVVSELISRKEFEKKYPDASAADFAVPSDTSSFSGLYWSTGDMVRLAEYWVKRPQTKRIVRLETGQTLDVTEIDKGQLSQLPIVAERKVKSYKVERYLVSGTEVLEGPDEWAGRFIPIFPVIGSEVALEEKIMRHGLIRFARDPQQLYNFARSATAEVIALQPRAPFLATAEMIGGYKAQWDSHNTTSRPYLLYKPDPDVPGGRPQREPPPALPEAFMHEAGISSDEMKATTGIYDAALGARSNEISGVAIKAREGQGNTSTLHYVDNLSATLHVLGQALIDLVPKIYDSQRTVRVLAEDGENEQPVQINVPVMNMHGKPVLLNDLNAGTYDVRIKIGPAYSTRRAEAADSMLQFVQTVPQAASVIGDLIAKNMDWPGAEEIADRLKKTLPPQLQDQKDPEVQQQAAQAQQQQAQQQQIMQGMAEAKLGEAQGKAQQAQAGAVKAQAEAQAIMSGQQGGVSPQDAALLDQQGMQAQGDAHEQGLKTALLEATLHERQSRATKADLDVQAGMIKNHLTMARANGPQSGYPSNL